MNRSMGCSEAREFEERKKEELFQASGHVAKGTGVLAVLRRKNCVAASWRDSGATRYYVGQGEKLRNGTSSAPR